MKPEPWNIRDRLISLDTTAHRLGVSRRTLYRMIEKGTIPKPVKLPGVARSQYPEYIVRDIVRQLAPYPPKDTKRTRRAS